MYMANEGQQTVCLHIESSYPKIKFIASKDMWVVLQEQLRSTNIQFLTRSGRRISTWELSDYGHDFDVDDQQSLLYIVNGHNVTVYRYDGQLFESWGRVDDRIDKILVHPTQDLVFLAVVSESVVRVRVYTKRGVFLHEFCTFLATLLSMSIHAQRNLLVLSDYMLAFYSFEGRCLSHLVPDLYRGSMTLDEDRDLLYVQNGQNLRQLEVYSL